MALITTPPASATRASPAKTSSSRTFPVTMVLATIAMLVVGFAIQLAVFAHGGHTALSDLPRVFLHRGVGPGALPYIDRVTEYPVGAGVLLYLAAVIAPTGLGVLVVTALFAGVICVAITVHLERRYGARAWRWAVAPPLVLFAFQNWDVFVIATVLLALFAYEQHRDRLAGAAIALGAAIKIFPAILVPPLVALRWARGDRRGARRLILSSVLVFGALNLPFFALHPSGWWWPFAFQSRRGPTWGTLWHWGFTGLGIGANSAAATQLVNVGSFVALTIGISWLSVRTNRDRLAPASAVCAGIAIFLLTNKVYSPTYDLWLVPGFVLLPLSRRLWITFCTVDLSIYLVAYGTLHAVTSISFATTVLPLLVGVRALVLLHIIAVATVRPRNRAAGRLPG